MSSIKSILSSLGEEQRKQLMYAFENELTQVIVYAGKKFIGINCSHLSNINITESKNSWVIGEIK